MGFREIAVLAVMVTIVDAAGATGATGATGAAGAAGPERSVAGDAYAAAMTYYNEGAYALAAEIAGADRSADALALASRAELAQAILAVAPRRAIKLARRAEGYAAAALAVDPEHVEANLQYAAAIGLRGKHVSRLAAHMKGLARKGRRHLERALDLAPGDPWALSLMGAWHMEVARRGGGRIYGASIEEGIAYYEAALAADPDNIVIAVNFADALAASGDPALRGRALDLARRAAAATPDDAFAAAMSDRAAALAAELAAS